MKKFFPLCASDTPKVARDKSLIHPVYILTYQLSSRNITNVKRSLWCNDIVWSLREKERETVIESRAQLREGARSYMQIAFLISTLIRFDIMTDRYN